MDGQLIECVPNFSEGRDASIIEAITGSIEAVEGVSILDVDMGYDFNRTVVTMVGEPEAVLEAAISCTTVAIGLIDMRNHTGEHARMGAVDVVPFIPLQGASMKTCVSLSERYAKAVSNRFDLPVFLYAEAARSDQRVRLPDIRRGEYEGLQEKIALPDWAPDFGPAEFKPKMGATASGARQILIAYNVNLNTSDKSKANAIAGIIRTSGVIVRDGNGDKVMDVDGKPVRKLGMFQSLQAAGWMYNEDTAQVSMNLLNHNVTGLHTVTDAIRTEAAEIGLDAVAGELVGLVPLSALISAGKHYHNDPDCDDHSTLVQSAINGLMLNELEEFDVHNSIIEWALESKLGD
jgi:glutamate formiminotransferase/formiminotetrahydrofolate cyclodeaminase